MSDTDCANLALGHVGAYLSPTVFVTLITDSDFALLMLPTVASYRHNVGGCGFLGLAVLCMAVATLLRVAKSRPNGGALLWPTVVALIVFAVSTPYDVVPLPLRFMVGEHAFKTR